MEGYESEKEQVEALKKWWKNNGSSTITGILLGLSLIFAGKAWFGYQDRKQFDASNTYAQFMAGQETGDVGVMSTHADTLIGDFSDSPYAGFAAMAMAKSQIEEGNLDAAAAQLQWVLDHAQFDAMRHAARLRLARLYLAQENYPAADSLLQQPNEGEYAGLYAELRGDSALAQGDRKRAEQQYAESLAALPEDAPTRNLVQLKQENVAMLDDTQ